MAQVAELGGPAVVTGLIVLVGVSIVKLISWTSVVTVSILVLTVLFGQLRIAHVERARQGAPTARLGIVQPDPVKLGWTRPAEDSGALERYQRATAVLEGSSSEPLDLILWPETAYPRLLRADAERDYPRDNDRRIRRGFSAPLLFGVTSVDTERRQIFNSAALVSGEGDVAVVYDKVQLILFSEWLPAWAAGWFGGVRYQRGSRYAGAPFFVASVGRSAQAAIFICFESIFPTHVRELVDRSDAELLINLTDDSWFGDTAEPEQHLSHSVFRAIESRRDLVRAAASGPSAHIAATGEILRRAPVNRRAGDDGSMIVEPRLVRESALFGHSGDLFAGACALGVVVLLLGGGYSRRRARRHD